MPIHSRVNIRYARALVLAAEKNTGLALLREEALAVSHAVDQRRTLQLFSMIRQLGNMTNPEFWECFFLISCHR
jgi:hypothetical protein